MTNGAPSPRKNLKPNEKQPAKGHGSSVEPPK